MEKVVDQLRGQVNSILDQKEHLFLVDIIKKGNDRVGKVIVLLDGDEGITIDECSEISRHLSRYIDENLDLSSPLTLEVSSAGLDHPLLLKRQYVRNIGRMVKVTLTDGEEIEGSLSSVKDDTISLEILVNKKNKIVQERSILFKEINKTIVLISFK